MRGDVAVCLAAGLILVSCGKYGPPVRAARTEPAARSAPAAEPSEEELEAQSEFEELLELDEEERSR